MKNLFRRFVCFVSVVAVVAILVAFNGSCFSPRTVVIGVIAPLDAGLVQFGQGIRNAVQLAVDEANDACALPGYRLELVALDDSSDPATGAAAAQTLAADARVIGVVGTYNSGVAAAAIPVLDEAGITMISPGNTDPALTLGDDPANPVRPHANYFRVVASDADQGPVLAQYAYQTMQARNAAVITETKPVSKGLADAFSAAFEALGGVIVTTEDLADGVTEYNEILARVAALEPDMIFFGGEYERGAAVRVAAGEAGIAVPMMGGDGIKAPGYIEAAGAACEGDIASSVGAPAESLPAAQPFLEAYEAAGFDAPATDFGPYAYDAAEVVIAAAKKSLRCGSPVDAAAREKILEKVQTTDCDGITGPIGFDAFGDTTNRVLTVYKVVDGMWVAQEE